MPRIRAGHFFCISVTVGHTCDQCWKLEHVDRSQQLQQHKLDDAPIDVAQRDGRRPHALEVEQRETGGWCQERCFQDDCHEGGEPGDLGGGLVEVSMSRVGIIGSMVNGVILFQSSRNKMKNDESDRIIERACDRRLYDFLPAIAGQDKGKEVRHQEDFHDMSRGVHGLAASS